MTPSSPPDLDVVVLGGGGHVGLPLSLVFAQAGLRVGIYDTNRATLERIAAGEMPFLENGADELLAEVLASGRLALGADAAMIARAAYRNLAVGGKDVIDGWGALGEGMQLHVRVRAAVRWPVLAVREWLRSPSPIGFADLPPMSDWDRPLRRLVPFVFAASTGFQLTKYIVVPEGLGFDARLYVMATKAWLAGGDPWATSLLGINFSAPPPTLLAMLPLTFVPEALLVPLAIAGSFALATVAIRALGLPLWWLAFWPIVDSALVGNPNIAVLALLVVAGRRLDLLAPFLKIYAVAPLIADRRWRSLAIAAILVIVTAPFLAWDRWFVSLTQISEALERTAQTTSVYDSVPLMVIGVIALLALGVRRAGWLAVPVLWPWTQPHYMAMSVPALSPMLAIVWSLPGIPPIVTLGSVVVAAIGLHVRPRRGETPTQAPLHLGASV